MMLLQARLLKDELNDSSRFEFLDLEIIKKVIRMDEVHPSSDNDGHYLFLIWVKPVDHLEIKRKIQLNSKRARTGDDWTTVVLPDTGDGLIIVSTWI